MAHNDYGAYGKEQLADYHVQKLVNQVVDTVNQETGQNYTSLEAIRYRAQVGEGIDYVIKVKDTVDNYLHLVIPVFKPELPNRDKPELNSVQQNKTLDDPLVPS